METVCFFLARIETRAARAVEAFDEALGEEEVPNAQLYQWKLNVNKHKLKSIMTLTENQNLINS